MYDYLLYTHKYNNGGVRLMKLKESVSVSNNKTIFFGSSFCNLSKTFIDSKSKESLSASIGSNNILEYKMFKAPDDDSAILIYELTKGELERNKYDNKTI